MSDCFRLVQGGKSIVAFPSDYTIVDLETTGLSATFDEIIEVAAIKVRGDEEVGRFQTLVKPENPICDFISDLTGITNEMVSNAPAFHAVAASVKEFVGDDVVVGHNVGFDVRFLLANFDQQGIEFTNDYINTIRLARKVIPGLPSYRLGCVAEAIGLESDPDAHRAMNDCLMTLRCYQEMKSRTAVISPDFSIVQEWFACRRYAHSKFDARLIQCQLPDEEIDHENPLYGKNVCFTGTLEKFTREQASQAVVNLGGVVQNGVTKKTDFLVLGNNDYCSSIVDGKSSKHKKAESYALSGTGIAILDECSFYAMIED